MSWNRNGDRIVAGSCSTHVSRKRNTLLNFLLDGFMRVLDGKQPMHSVAYPAMSIQQVLPGKQLLRMRLES